MGPVLQSSGINLQERSRARRLLHPLHQEQQKRYPTLHSCQIGSQRNLAVRPQPHLLHPLHNPSPCLCPQSKAHGSKARKLSYVWRPPLDGLGVCAITLEADGQLRTCRAAKGPPPAPLLAQQKGAQQQPRVKLRPLFWTKVPARADTIWAKVVPPPAVLTEDQLTALERLFPQAASTVLAKTQSKPGEDGFSLASFESKPAVLCP